MLTVLFSNLEYHFSSKKNEIDEEYFITFEDDTIKKLYDNMLTYTHNTAIMCNLIYQMLKRDPENLNVVFAAVGAIDYQNSKATLNKKLFSLTEECIEKNKIKMLHFHDNQENLNYLRLMAYFGHILSIPEHEPIYSFKMF